MVAYTSASQNIDNNFFHGWPLPTAVHHSQTWPPVVKQEDTRAALAFSPTVTRGSASSADIEADSQTHFKETEELILLKLRDVCTISKNPETAALQQQVATKTIAISYDVLLSFIQRKQARQRKTSTSLIEQYPPKLAYWDQTSSGDEDGDTPLAKQRASSWPASDTSQESLSASCLAESANVDIESETGFKKLVLDRLEDLCPSSTDPSVAARQKEVASNSVTLAHEVLLSYIQRRNLLETGVGNEEPKQKYFLERQQAGLTERDNTGSAGSAAYRESSDILKSDLFGEAESDGVARVFSLPDVIPTPISRTMSLKDVRMVIGIDFGTTYTGVAFALVQSNVAKLEDIQVIQEWTSKMSNQYKVPSVYSYSRPKYREAQWGSDISDNAITLMNLKLELDPQDSRLDELQPTHSALRGANEDLRRMISSRDYPTKTPEQIVADYLTRIYECVCHSIEPEPRTLALTKTPVDLVITVPANWSYKALNATFRAVRTAGFNPTNFPTLNNTILISEPEAASYFTIQHLQALKAEFLEIGDCFILADAGGGTVDVVTLEITAETPQGELRKVTVPNSGKCGSAYIDAAFKQWLRDTALGARWYSKLDPSHDDEAVITVNTHNSRVPGPMRELMKRFEIEKRRFSIDSYDVRLELPAPLNTLNIDGRVRDGELTIYQDEMRRLFKPCINDIIGLIEEQIKQLSEDFQRRLKSVLLLGGFGASAYLQGTLAEALKLGNIEMHRLDADNSWTAVVQGAVVYGIEKTRHPNATLMHALTNSYGIAPDNAFEWMVRSGDLIASNRDSCVSSKPFFIPTHRLEKSKIDLKIYRYPSNDDDHVPESLQLGQYGAEEVAVVSCDLSHLVSRFSRESHIGPLKVTFRLSGRTLASEVSLCDTVVGICKTEVIVGL